MIDCEDAEILGMTGLSNFNGLLANEDRSLIRTVCTRQDLNQRGLAGTVFADKDMHLTSSKIERDIPKRNNAREAFRDLLRFQLSGKRLRIDHAAQNPRRSFFSEVELASPSVEIRFLDPGSSGSSA